MPNLMNFSFSLNPGRWLRASLAVLAIAIGGSVNGLTAELPLARIVLETSTGAHIFDVEIARTSRHRARGLMFREKMADDHGMLFIYPDTRQRYFWMKNTPLSLDIIFLDRGRVVHIARDATPHSRAVIPSGAPADRVLELVAGRAVEIGLKVGDRLRRLPENAGKCRKMPEND